jgi:hypothetical protein
MAICKVCGKSFEGRKNAAFCSSACAKKQQSLYMQRYYYKTKLLNSGYTDEEATKMAKEKYAYKTPIAQLEEKTIIQQDNVSPTVAKQDDITFDWALETDEYIKDVGAIRSYAKELESVVGKLMVYYNKYSNRFNEIENWIKNVKEEVNNINMDKKGTGIDELKIKNIEEQIKQLNEDINKSNKNKILFISLFQKH